MTPNPILTFSDLRDALREMRGDEVDDMVENLETLTEFQRGTTHGFLTAIWQIDQILRDAIKHHDVK